MKWLQRIMKNTWVRLSAMLIAGLGVIFLFVFVVNWGMSNKARTELMEQGTFIEGVSISGVDVSGKTMAQAKEAVVEQAREMLKKTVVRFRVGETVYRLTGAQLGTLVDYESVMEQAMLCGRDGSLLSNLSTKHKAKKEGISFELDVQLDQSVLESTIKEMSNTFNTTVQDAQVVVDVSKTSSTQKVESQIYASEPVVGRAVDIKALIESIAKAVEQDCTLRTITAVWEETLPQSVDTEAIMENCQMIGSYTTSLENTESAELSNIWKASGLLAGLRVKPGETVSILSLMGEMTQEEGWMDANVIGSDSVILETGGGVSQVVSTLYVALLQAEVQIDTIQHHTWAPDYITAGLDACISSSENIDFIFTNPYDSILYILVNCDGSEEKKLTIDIYGAPLGYSVEISTEVIMDYELSDEAVVNVDESKQPGYSEWVKPRKNRVKIDVWKIRKDDESGEQVGSKLYIGETQYPGLVGEQIIGPQVEELQKEEAQEEVEGEAIAEEEQQQNSAQQ